MSNKCEICGKGSQSGHIVSHSNRKANKTSRPNVQKINAVVDGSPRRMKICTRCLRSGKAQKRSA